MQPRSRRTLLQGSLALATTALLPRRAFAARDVRFVGYPFALGVASGYPTPTGVTLWTRLAPAPLLPDGGMDPENVRVAYEVAEDEAFKTVVQRGAALAVPEWAHAVHVDVVGLQPGRWYFYRFIAGDELSPVGRTRTAEAPGQAVGKLRFGVGSCQHFEHGWYVAQRHLAAESLDLMVFLGDYIYEKSWGQNPVRQHRYGEVATLDEYRVRYAQYRTDLDLQRLHAVVPWIICWDDHEVDNDWADGQGEHFEPSFQARRAAAFQAWYEHMPVPARMRPTGPSATIYDSFAYGDLLRFSILDDRQHRSPQPCPDPEKGAGSTTRAVGSCPELQAPDRTLLGDVQERWLDQRLKESRQRWNIVAQQTLVSPSVSDEAGERRFWTDGWDGYPAARDRLLRSLARSRTSNPVIVGGDIHATVIADLRARPDDPGSPVLASELCGTSLTSQSSSKGKDEGEWEARQAINPHFRYASGRKRGYLLVEVEGASLHATVVGVDEKRKDSPREALAAFRVDDGKPGPKPVA